MEADPTKIEVRQEKSQVQLVELALASKYAWKIPTDWRLSGMGGREREILREEARRNVEKAQGEIWNFLARHLP